jgi:RNA polymerase sigma factor (sigma-70 family)
VVNNGVAVLKAAVRSVEALAEQPGASDRELLRRFADENDQAAFAVLVRRYSGLVLGACRRVLRDTQAAEDACQATFLVLARKAATGRWRHNLAGWLYATARQIAANARRAAQRRARREGRAALPEAVEPADQVTGRELLAMLDEELARLPPRYREPLLLCCLEGLTRDEAAARLGVGVGTLKSQLERGRKHLAEALSRRGCALGAGLAALAGASTARASPHLVQAVLASTAGAPPAAVAALAREVSVSTLLSRSLWVLVAATAAAWLGIAAWASRPGAAGPVANNQRPARAQAAGPKPADPSEGRTLAGRVVGPDGKPVARAVVVLASPDEKGKKTIREVATTGADGRFRCLVPGRRLDGRLLVARAPGLAADWVALRQAEPEREVVLRLAKASVVVRGRVLTLEGKPVPGAVVRLLRVEAPDGKVSLKQFYDKWAASPYQAVDLLPRRLHHPAAAGLPEKLTTDRAGRFEVRGAGDGRVLVLEVAGETIETVLARVAVDRAGPPRRAGQAVPGPLLYPATFDHAAAPCRVIQGTVLDRRTRKPLAGVPVSGHVLGGWWEVLVHARTDEAGRYRLVGLRNAECKLVFGPGKESAYLALTKAVPRSTGLAPATLDMPMVRGTVVTGRVTDRQTGKPIRGGIAYFPLSGNRHLNDLPGKDVHAEAVVGYHLDASGRFRFIAPPGIGIITVQVHSGGGMPYPPARIRAEDRGKPYLKKHPRHGDMLITSINAYIPLSSCHDYRLIDPPAGAEKLSVDIQLDPGKTVAGKVVGPDGKPLGGATVAGRAALFDEPATLKDDAFTAAGLREGDTRMVAAVHAGKKLGGTAVVGPGEKAPPVIRLAAWGTLTGRVVGPNGEPLAGAHIGLAFGFPGVKFSARPTPPASAPAKLYAHLMGGRKVTTDASGRFRCDVPFPGTKFSLSFVHKGKRLQPENPRRDLTVGPGEGKSLGDVVVKGAD